MVAASPAALDDHALLAGWQAGDLSACGSLVRRLQRPSLELAYLLTGDADAAAELATGALVAALRRMARGEDEPRLVALGAVVERGLREQPSITVQDGPAAGERQRLLAALAICDPESRALLGLTRLARLDRATALRLIPDPGTRLPERATIAARRVREAVGADPNAELFPILARLVAGVPRRELWPEIEPEARAMLERRRRRSRALSLAVASAVGLLALVGLYWLVDPGWFDDGTAEQGASAAPAVEPELERELQQAPLAEVTQAAVELAEAPVVRDVELLSVAGQGEEPPSATYLLAENGALEEIGPGGELLIARDASWILIHQSLPEDRMRITAVHGGRLQAMWSREIAEPEALAITSDWLFTLLLSEDGTGYVLRRFNTGKGQPFVDLPLDLDVVDDATTRLIPSLDGQKLYLLIETLDYVEHHWALTVATIDAESGEVLATRERRGDPGGVWVVRDFQASSARLTADGSALFSVIALDARYRVGVQFIDLETGELTSLELPFPLEDDPAKFDIQLIPSNSGRRLYVFYTPRREMAVIGLVGGRVEGMFRIEAGAVGALELPFPLEDDPAKFDIQLIPSNSGRRLYVFYTPRREMAVIDLVGRRVEGIFPIEAGAFDALEFARSFRRASYVLADLSPDGQTLYLGLVYLTNRAASTFPTASPVWEIDTASWRATGQVDAPGQLRTMMLSADGERLLAQSVTDDGALPITEITTADLQARQLPPPETPDWADSVRLLSLHGVYRWQYLRTPATLRVTPRDNETLALLPHAQIEAPPITAGNPGQLTIRLVHPTTGEPLSAASEDVRFDPEAKLTMTLRHGSGATAFLVPYQTGLGAYEGTVMLDQPGGWDVSLRLENADGTTWEIGQAGRLDVRPGLIGEDGRDYILEARPESPVARRMLTIHGWIVDAETGRRIAGDVQLAGGLPATIQLNLTSPDGEQKAVIIEALEHGRYIGWVRLGEPGEWQVTATIHTDGDNPVQLRLPPLEIRELGARPETMILGRGALS